MTRKDAAAGVDGMTAKDYERDLEANLERLLNAAKAGTYRAPPVRRVLIPKGEGKMRPLGIPTHEDKVLQRAVAMVLEPRSATTIASCISSSSSAARCSSAASWLARRPSASPRTARSSPWACWASY
ncbi:hypothetical protein [Nannocystis pusilla]|uniref:hypothetical protein n=1 Tax=Nannocystis pusilla TaxID=889268 RepID=UPI003B7E5315